MKPPRPSHRGDLLLERQRAKMARSAQTYVRGSTEKFYAWLEAASGTLPDGPAIWICGDCHHGNLGPVANQKGEVEIQIRDLDQTVIGNPAHDIVRLAFSLASAARGFDLPGIATARMVEEVVAGYMSGLGGETGEAPPPVIKKLLRSSRRRSWRHLATERIHDPEPTIPLGKRFWPLSGEERKAIAEAFATPEVTELVTALHSRPSDAKIELLDAAYWVKGCSSLGRLRYAALVGVEGPKGREFGLFDLKEAVRAAAPRASDVSMPRDNAERVVAGARALAPFLGDRMRALRLMGRAVFLRELLPQDLKLDIRRLDAEAAAQTARFLAQVVGRAHGRQMQDDDVAAWSDELGRRRSKSLDAPSWLWRSVVELMSAHEGAYLDHCRRCASIVA